MRQLWIVVALAGTGCNQLLGIDELTRVDAGGGSNTIDAPLIDAAPIDSIDSPPAMTCAAQAAARQAFTTDPTDAIEISIKESVNSAAHR